jgi:hypothetical protein
VFPSGGFAKTVDLNASPPQVKWFPAPAVRTSGLSDLSPIESFLLALPTDPFFINQFLELPRDDFVAHREKYSAAVEE